MPSLFFGHCGTCKRCKQTFYNSASRNYCPTCYPQVRAWAQRQQRTSSTPRRRYNAPTPAQEAYDQGDAEMYRAALRGELD